MKIYSTVKELAIKNGVSIAEIERELKFGNGTISRWDRSLPNIENVVKISDYFGLTVDQLLKLKPKECFTFCWEATSEKSIDIYAESREEALNIWIEGQYNHNEINTNDEDMDPKSLTLNDEYVEVG